MNTKAATSKTNEKPVLIISGIFLLASMVCLIINYSVNQSISWSLYPIGALVMLWAMIVPMLLMHSHRSLGFFIGLATTLIPFLFLIQSQTKAKGWVIQLALPIAVLSLVALGVSLLCFSYMKTNKFYPVALTIFLFGVVVNYGIEIFLSRFLNGRDNSNIDDISRVSTMSISVALTVIFIIAGYTRGRQKSKS